MNGLRVTVSSATGAPGDGAICAKPDTTPVDSDNSVRDAIRQALE